MAELNEEAKKEMLDGGENSIEQVNHLPPLSDDSKELMKIASAADQIESEVRDDVFAPKGSRANPDVMGESPHGSDPGVSASSETLSEKLDRLLYGMFEISNKIKNRKAEIKDLQLNHEEIKGYAIKTYQEMNTEEPYENFDFRVYWNKGKTVVEWDSNALAIAECLHQVDLPDKTKEGIDQMVFTKILKFDKKRMDMFFKDGLLKHEDFEGVRTVKPPERRIEVKEL